MAAPTEAKRYEMLRRNVKTPHLEYLVVQLSLPEAIRIKLETFFEDCNHVTRYNKEWDSGHERKAEEVFGRQVTIKRDVQYLTVFLMLFAGDVVCQDTSSSSTSTMCSLCKARIGGDSHDALLDTELKMSWQTTSPANSTVRHVSLDSDLTAKGLLGLALLTAVPLLVVASDMIAILKEGLKLDASGFRQTELNNKIFKIRILSVPAEHLIALRFRGRLPNRLHLLYKLRVLLL